MAGELIDLNVYRRRRALKNQSGLTPACYPEPSSRFPAIIFSYPEESFIVNACKLSQLMDELTLDAIINGHTLVIQDCIQHPRGEWGLKIAVFEGEEPVYFEDAYYNIISAWNRRHKTYS